MMAGSSVVAGAAVGLGMPKGGRNIAAGLATGSHDSDANFQYTVNALADAWETEEIKEGIGAFLVKRKPNWIK